MNRWWKEVSEEIYWLEITDRDDIGVDLNAPQRRDDGKPFWGYSLINEVRHGDIVVHYDKRRHAIVGLSEASGGVWEDEVVWGAHGTTARGAGISPYRRPGWRLGLEGFTELENRIALDEIRAEWRALSTIRGELAEARGQTLYFPFEVSGRRPPRPVQGYLAKLPSRVVALFPTLRDAIAGDRPTSREGVGVRYRPADETRAVSQRDPFTVDPALVERGTRGHARTQNALADFLRSREIEPRSPQPGEPNYDVAWSLDGRLHVAEVKSLTRANEEKQLRLGLGQVLRYRQLLSTTEGEDTVGVLVVEREPSDPSWRELCRRLGIVLAWPDRFRGVT